MTSYGFRLDSNGDPLIEDCQKHMFGEYYASPESLSIFRAMYMNTDGLADKFVNYWAKVTQALHSNPFVLGYDPFNEPSPSWTSWQDLFNTIYPGNFDKGNLAPLYTRVNQDIQNVDKDGLLWFEPAQFPDGFGIGTPLIFNVGFQTPPGGKIGSANHVLNDHTYCCQLSPGICAETGEPLASEAAKCLNFHQKKLSTRLDDAKRLGIPLYIGEFGACLDSNECVTEINQVADITEEINASGWAYWEFKTYKDLTTSAGNRSEGFYNFDGSLQGRKVKALGRTYVMSAQGTLQKSKFATSDSSLLKAGQFVADMIVDTSITAPTLIHALKNAPLAWYPQGWELSVLKADGTAATLTNKTEDTVNNKISFQINQSALEGKTVRICVTPVGQKLDCHGFKFPAVTYANVETPTE